MAFADDDLMPEPPLDRRISLGVLVLMLMSFIYLTYGPGFDYALAGLGALFAFPFSLGALATQVGDKHGSLRWRALILIPIGVMLVIFPLAYFGIGEGLICIAMIMPFWLSASIGGALVSAWNARRADKLAQETAAQQFNVFALAALPFALIFAEEAAPPAWQSATVERSVVIEATPSEIWPLLNALLDIQPDEGKATFTHDWLNVPRPAAAIVQVEDDVAVRKALWGDDVRFSEVITDSVPNQQIAWRFEFHDDSVQQYTDKHIDPDGPILKIAEGAYSLKHISDDQTELILETTYNMRTRAGWYLKLWGEVLLGDVSENVLEIVKSRAERKQ